MQPQYGAPAPVQPNYDFIVNPGPPPRRPLMGGSSMLSRVLIVGAGLIILIVAFSVIKGLLSGGGNQAALLHVVQDQQEIIHLTTAAGQVQSISTTNKNFAVSANLVASSQKDQLLAYMQKQHQKVSLAQANMKISTTIDSQLTTATAASTYDQTFHDIMNSQLTDYEAALQLAYQQTPGPNGRKLLTDAYNSAKLLQQQLNPAS